MSGWDSWVQLANTVYICKLLMKVRTWRWNFTKMVHWMFYQSHWPFICLMTWKNAYKEVGWGLFEMEHVLFFATYNHTSFHTIIKITKLAINRYLKATDGHKGLRITIMNLITKVGFKLIMLYTGMLNCLHHSMRCIACVWKCYGIWAPLMHNYLLCYILFFWSIALLHSASIHAELKKKTF